MPWYIQKPNNASGWPPSPKRDEARNEIRVPRNLAAFRRCRAAQAATATMAVTMAVGFCSFPATLIYILLVDPSPQSLILEVFGFLMSALIILVVGLAAGPALQQAKDSTWVLAQNLPAVIINQEGIWDYSSSYIFGFVPWNEIDSVMLDSRYSRELGRYFYGIAFVVKNKEVLLRRKSAMTRFSLNMESGIVDRRQIFIPQQFVDVPVKDLVQQIADFRAKIKL